MFLVFFLKEKTENGLVLKKYIEIDVTCHVTLHTKSVNDEVMRVTGTAVMSKKSKEKKVKLLKIENIGLDSQINLLFIHEDEKLIFVPI